MIGEMEAGRVREVEEEEKCGVCIARALRIYTVYVYTKWNKLKGAQLIIEMLYSLSLLGAC